jgi:nucleoid-associated protein YgaU
MKMNTVRWILCISVLIVGVIGIGKGLGPSIESDPVRANQVMTSPVTLSWYSVDERARQWLDEVPVESSNNGAVTSAEDPQVDPGSDRTAPTRGTSLESPLLQHQGTERSWTIRPGDSFWKIARDVLGSIDHYQALIEANRSIDPDRLQVGQVISLPAIGAAVKVGSSVAVESSAPLQHKVGSGETLATIARDYYGVADWNRLFEANRDRISNPDRLKIGTWILIPQQRSAGERSDR